MRFQFSVPDSTATDFDYLVQHTPYVGLTPRLLTINLIAQAAKDHRQEQTTSTPKQPVHRETAEERKKREGEEYRERRLNGFRETGEWPRVQRYKQLPGNISAYKDGQAEFHEGKILFTMPGDPDRSYTWMPSEDYPFMDDYQKAQREMAEMMGEVDPNYPKLEDYETSEEFYDAENLYLRTTERDAIDAMPALSAPVRMEAIVPASSTSLADELQAIFDMD